MKQINDLLVVEVPSWVEHPQINDAGLLRLNIDSLPIYKQLPSGSWAIIGIAGGIGIFSAREVLKCAGYPFVSMIWTNYRVFMEDNNLRPTDTTDLLFLKRITI